MASNGKVCSHKYSKAFDSRLRELLQPPKKFLSPFLFPGSVAIDLGCGPGFFTLPMVELVGSEGKVIGVDLQQEMLDRLAAKCHDPAIFNQLQLHRCQAETIGLAKEIKADFILAFYMVHEVPDRLSFLSECKNLLAPGGKMLLIEPLFHVSKKDFESTLRIAAGLGFTTHRRSFSLNGRAVVLSGET